MIFPWNKYILFVFLILLQSCGPKRAIYESSGPQPDWIRTRPVTPGYYTGIGWSQKSNNIHHYQQTAKQNALADLAGEISVTISSNSVLHAFESKLGFREDFSSTIQARTREELSGFELTATWEDQNNYWVYYTLSVAKHREIKKQQKNDAVNLSLDLFKSAIERKEDGDLRIGIIQLINSLEAIKNYFEDPLPVEFNGRNIQLGNEIFNELSSTISEISITPAQEQITIKRGRDISSDLLKFKVSNQSGTPVSDFPLVGNYSERPIRNSRIRTGRDGFGHFYIDGARSSEDFETFTVSADIERILAETNADPLTSRLIRRFSLPGAKSRINILKPVLALISTEESPEGIIKEGKLETGFRKSAVREGYIINNDPDTSDFLAVIKAKAIVKGGTGPYLNAILTGSITVRNSEGNIIYHRELDGFNGSHFSTERAVEEAYQQAAGRMERSFFREIDEALIKGY